MYKRLLATSLLAAAALATVSAHSFGAPPASPPRCYSMSYYSNGGTRPATLTYDTTGGLTVAIRDNTDNVQAHLALAIGDEPNPHFDRLYALLMKGFDNERIGQICVDPTPDAAGAYNLVSVTLKHVEPAPTPDLQKVQICDGYHCAYLGTYGEVPTTK